MTNWPLHAVLRSAPMTVSRYPPAAGSITKGNRACEQMFRTESSFTQRMTALSNTEPTDGGRSALRAPPPSSSWRRPTPQHPCRRPLRRPTRLSRFVDESIAMRTVGNPRFFRRAPSGARPRRPAHCAAPKTLANEHFAFMPRPLQPFTAGSVKQRIPRSREKDDRTWRRRNRRPSW